MYCNFFTRPAPLGQKPLSDWTQLENSVAFNLYAGLIDRANYLFQRDYDMMHPYHGECELKARTFNNAFVGPFGAVISKEDGLVCPDVLYHQPTFSGSVIQLEAAVNLKQYNDTSYYHFVSELLPRFLAWKDDGKTPVLVGIGPAANFVYEFFELLGVKRNRVLGIESARVNRLYWPNYTPWPQDEQGEFPREPLLALRERLRPKNLQKMRIAFIVTRPDPTSTRECANLTEIKNHLQRAGYETHLVESHNIPSAREEIKLFSQASLLVGAQSGALTNLLWMPNGASVIEIHTGGIPPHRSIWHLAACLDQRYYSLFTDQSRNVDLKELVSILTDIWRN